MEPARDPLTERVIGSAIEVHRCLGPGLLESVYERCLSFELNQSGLRFQVQHPLPICYKGEHLDGGLRLDLFVEDRLIVELKSVDEILPIHEAQLLTYLKLSGVRVGLLINFNVLLLKNGIRRFVN